MSNLTNTQDAALQHLFTEYTEDSWDIIVNKNSWDHNTQYYDWFRSNSQDEIREMLICLEQMLHDFYVKVIEAQDKLHHGI